MSDKHPHKLNADVSVTADVPSLRELERISSTPWTDAEEAGNHGGIETGWVLADFARDLEREADGLRSELSRHVAGHRISREIYEKEIKRLRVALEQAEKHFIMILNSIDQDEQEAFIACGRAAIEEALKGGAE